MRTDIYDLKTVYESHLLRGLTRDEADLVMDSFPFVFRTYDKGETIINQGDYVKEVGIITEGKITCSKYHYDGTYQLLQILGRGDSIGLEAISSSFLTSPYTIISDNFSIVAFFPYIRFLGSPGTADRLKLRILKNVLNIVADDNIRKMYKIDVLSRRRLRERVMAYLSIISEKKNSRTIDIGMTQEQFAHYLCVNRSVLSKELNDMKREKVIDFKGSVYTINGSTNPAV